MVHRSTLAWLPDCRAGARFAAPAAGIRATRTVVGAILQLRFETGDAILTRPECVVNVARHFRRGWRDDDRVRIEWWIGKNKAAQALS